MRSGRDKVYDLAKQAVVPTFKSRSTMKVKEKGDGEV